MGDSELVLSKSDETGEVSYRKVVNTFIRQTDAIYTVSFTDGTVLETTWNHPFRVKKQGHVLEKFSIENTTWVQAKDLHPGDVALGADGKELVITDIIIDERVETVYNFEVEEYHTYFVGEVGVWVHNECELYTNEVKIGGISSGKHHAFIIATPDDQKAFQEYIEKNKDSGKVFQKVDENGNPMVDKNGEPVYSIILRAGPDGAPPDFGRLSNLINIEKDYVRMNMGDFSSRSIINAPNGNDSDFIRSLLKSDSNYTQNYHRGVTPEYEPFPDTDEFENNSNSYVNGLLQSVGVISGQPNVTVPGWNKPVERNLFVVPNSRPISTNRRGGVCGQNMSCNSSPPPTSGCGINMSCRQ
ncbi:polymorphic toxin-type HINT domain-containing protein [Leptospira harrisiae]|uniref:polymorphic toxin-type HINT domain-containing protein n=1 Tax=Leptospira harrisiae TaxID=2023189 RepID=UPI0013FDC945|nr:polymorphic toxin-type HINT domain-containing protein [Leptospira harrisiae]